MDLNNESKIKKVLFNEVSFLVAGIGLVSSVMFWVMNPQRDMEIQIIKLQGQVATNESVGVMLQKFKDNDLHEMQLKLDKIENQQIEILKSTARLEVLIGVK